MPEVDGISDGEWLALILQTSHGGRYFFSENQLYLAYARNRVQVTRIVGRRALIGLGMIALGLATWMYALKADWGIPLILGIVVTLSGVGMVGTGVVTVRTPAPRERVSGWLAKWLRERPLPQLLSAPALDGTALDGAPPDAACLLIVEREALVDLLLRNGAERELQAVIIAESGYPGQRLADARRWLSERPELQVVLLHDATPRGSAMPARLGKSQVFSLGDRSLLEAGLFPADVTWLAELAPAIPAGHTQSVPADSLSYRALIRGLRGVLNGAPSLVRGIEDGAEAPRSSEATVEPTVAQRA
jgi:hypothetical protein